MTQVITTLLTKPCAQARFNFHHNFCGQFCFPGLNAHFYWNFNCQILSKCACHLECHAAQWMIIKASLGMNHLSPTNFPIWVLANLLTRAALYIGYHTVLYTCTGYKVPYLSYFYLKWSQRSWHHFQDVSCSLAKAKEWVWNFWQRLSTMQLKMVHVDIISSGRLKTILDLANQEQLWKMQLLTRPVAEGGPGGGQCPPTRK
jgi:hypothetical protein